MAKAVKYLLTLAGAGALLGAIALLIVAPRMDWSATARPGSVEKGIANAVLRRWVRNSASAENNPVPASEENLKAGMREFGEHCAVCHGADGSAHDRLGANFYPPIARLERGAAGWSDGELYFIIGNGIRYTGMPGFGCARRSLGKEDGMT
jgi:mono/diheme cytochrome c family protein